MNTEGEKILDELHCRLSELKIRVAKLEQYARLQDDLNRANVHYLKPGFFIEENYHHNGMAFEAAITWFKKRKYIRRKSWGVGIFISIKQNSSFFQFSHEDIMSLDWEIIE